MTWTDRLIIAISLIGLLGILFHWITTGILPIFRERDRDR